MKHFHMMLAFISVSFFILRFIWLQVNTDMLRKKWVKISPHIIDTLLFAVGIGMAVKLKINPFEYLWLGEKLLAIVAYIFTAYYALKLARNRPLQIFAFFGALGWVLVVVRIAMTKQTFFF